jgi:hypothetical protein
MEKNHILHFCLCYSAFPFCAFVLLDMDVVERSLVRDSLSLSLDLWVSSFFFPGADFGPGALRLCARHQFSGL